MKTRLIIMAAFVTLALTPRMYAQWTQSGNDTYYNLSGNVEIGNPTSPTFPTKLYVETGTTGDGIKLTQTSTSALDFASLFLQLGATNYWSLNHTGAGFTLFESAGGGNVRLHVKNGTGNVGIGTGAPTARLHVVENTGTTASAIGIHGVCDGGSTDNFGIYGEVGATGGTANNIGVYGFLGNNAGTMNAAIYADANGYSSASNTVPDWAVYINGDLYRSAGSFGPSDRKLKTDVRPLQNALDKLLLLKPSSYVYKFDEFPAMGLPRDTQMGLIAQELEEVFPNLIIEIKEHKLPTKEGQAERIIPPHKALNYEGLIPVLISSLQEEHKLVQDLQKKVEILEQQTSLLPTKSSLISTGELDIAQTSGYAMETNIPNPFSRETAIAYTLPQQEANAFLAVYDLNGKQIKTITLNDRGSSKVILSADTLAAGIYVYAIISDGKVVDSKRMIIADKE